MFIGCGHVVRLAAVHAVGVYEPAPGSYGGEEKDLSLRLMDAGYAILSLPGVHVWHEKTSIARVVPKQQSFDITANDRRFLRSLRIAADETTEEVDN